MAVLTFQWKTENLPTLGTDKNIEQLLVPVKFPVQVIKPGVLTWIIVWQALSLYTFNLCASKMWCDQAKWVGTRKYWFGDRAKQRK